METRIGLKILKNKKAEVGKVVGTETDRVTWSHPVSFNHLPNFSPDFLPLPHGINQ
jgi:hypothetical protein